MPLYKTKGIVLNTYKLGEADKIIVLISPERGKIRAVAKGVRKTKSKFGSRLEPFTFIDLMLYEGKNLDIVNQAEIIDSFKEIRADLNKLKYGSVMLELADKVSQENEDSRQVFLLLLNALKELKTSDEKQALLLAIFELKLMSVIGFSPHIDQCAACGVNTKPGNLFSIKYGGLLCAGCIDRDPAAIPLSNESLNRLPEVIKATSYSWKDLDISEKSENDILKLADAFAAYHMDRPINSSKLLGM